MCQRFFLDKNQARTVQGKMVGREHFEQTQKEIIPQSTLFHPHSANGITVNTFRACREYSVELVAGKYEHETKNFKW